MVRDLEQYSAWRQDVLAALQAYRQAASTSWRHALYCSKSLTIWLPLPMTYF